MCPGYSEHCVCDSLSIGSDPTRLAYFIGETQAQQREGIQAQQREKNPGSGEGRELRLSRGNRKQAQ